jgi:hypothetical protein
MNWEQFKTSLQEKQPPSGITSALAAMWYDGKGEWEQAHMIAQDIPTREGSLVHAYLHRKEGDEWNAGYWYNRAGQSIPDVSLDQEWQQLVQSFLGHKSA